MLGASNVSRREVVLLSTWSDQDFFSSDGVI